MPLKVRKIRITSSVSSPVAKPAEMVNLFYPDGVVDIEFDGEFKAMSKNYQNKNKSRTNEPSLKDPPAPSSSLEYNEAGFFDEQGEEILKIKQ
ncbi:hypothetical protein AYI70_g6115 [Smittium culicis]|uniref:Uncharacterized protein n=1 Tax=Smittium culicis TaxID=133412 RepID=A0A1R1XRF9_9FUNG|nr:hypothetical protein AYI70_g6115 [Smittium culicis]